jgi:hypothetical protein
MFDVVPGIEVANASNGTQERILCQIGCEFRVPDLPLDVRIKTIVVLRLKAFPFTSVEFLKEF